MRDGDAAQGWARGPDLAELAVALVGELRSLGVAVNARQAARLTRAMVLATPATPEELYWVGRVTLISDPDCFAAYDQVFDRFFGGLLTPRQRLSGHIPGVRSDTASIPSPASERPGRAASDVVPRAGGILGGDSVHPGGPARGGAEPSARGLLRESASRLERLSSTDFAELSAEELAELRELMSKLRLSIPPRPARRRRRHRRGDRADLRATLRRSRRSGGDPLEQVRRRAVGHPRKLVVLCDISGSMAAYSRACIQLLHAAAGGSDAEVFSFATRLSRLTKPLRLKDPDAAMTAAAATAPDWASGTRIGEALESFLDQYGRRGIARGAVVLIVSDGWDRGDPAQVGKQMARLRRLAYRIVWVNPRSAAAGFAPRAAGMAAALPYCDVVMSGETLSALGEAMAALDPRAARASMGAPVRLARSKPLRARELPPGRRGI